MAEREPYTIHLRGEETLHLDVLLSGQDAALLQRIARMSEDLHDGYEAYMTIEPPPEDGSPECHWCGATIDAGLRDAP
jgi:hypothetical protein